MSVKRLRLAAASLGGMVLEGCSAVRSATNPIGPQARAIDRLWWVMFWLGTAIFASVLVFTLAAALRRRQPMGEERADYTSEEQRKLTRVIGVLTGGTALVLLGLLVATVRTSSAISVDTRSNAQKILITGHDWWWQVDYRFDDPSQNATTANEIHIPAGRPVQLVLQSQDVIHSFWIPPLFGKIDLVPGQTNAWRILADRPGTYAGQCAEFCGLQHAKMRLTLVVEPEAQFQSWLARQREPAPQPAGDTLARGAELFATNACAFCHNIAGTQAGGRTAPDLTHFGSRSTIGAGTMPNTLGNLEGWIVNAQAFKPGAKMPPLNQFDATSLRQLAVYLESLK